MAKITLEFDSVTKKAMVFIDGKEVSDANYVCFYGYEHEEGEKKWEANIETTSKKEDGLRVMKRIVAADKDKQDYASEDKTLVFENQTIDKQFAKWLGE